MKRKQITYYYRGEVERGNGKPGYDWHPAWSANNEEGRALYPWLTRKECLEDAKRQGATAIFYPQ